MRRDRKGLYRSRRGNYDQVFTDGLFTLSEGLVAADLLACRLILDYAARGVRPS